MKYKLAIYYIDLVCVYVGGSLCHATEVRGQLLVVDFSPSTMWVPGFKLKSLGLVVSHLANPTDQNFFAPIIKCIQGNFYIMNVCLFLSRSTKGQTFLLLEGQKPFKRVQSKDSFQSLSCSYAKHYDQKQHKEESSLWLRLWWESPLRQERHGGKQLELETRDDISPPRKQSKLEGGQGHKRSKSPLPISYFLQQGSYTS